MNAIAAKTLDLLEWSRLCQHLATFANTKLGLEAARSLAIPATQAASSDLLEQTEAVYSLEHLRHTSLSFDGIHDLASALERASRQGILSGEELLNIATTLAGARNLRRLIDRQPDFECLQELVAPLRTYPELEQEIHRCIDEQGQVADRASLQLAQIRDRQRQVRDQVYRLLQNLLQRRSNAVQESLITQRGDRFVIPVKATHKDLIAGIVHDTSASGATLYVEPQASVNLNNQLRQLARQEQTEAEAIRRQLSQQVEAVVPDLEELLQIITALDLATARARYSTWLGGNRPRFSDRTTENLVLRQLRHPLLIWQHQHEQAPPVVPIDLVVQPHTQVVVITGPNTGGKTATLKTLGLIALMAKAGLFIPAREPVELPWFAQVLADIGDEQSLQQSLSTFSGHIRCISQILGSLPAAPALVLLDEVGAGTDPTEGTALAIALLHYLADQADLTVATTHFGELKALKYQDQRFENASVEFDQASLAPTYRLLWGIPGRSNALAIAERLGLDPGIIAQAAGYLGGSTDQVNQVIAGLEAQRQNQEARTQAAAQLLSQTEQLHEQISEQSRKLKAREQQLQQEQEQTVRAAIATAKAEIAQLIRQLQQGPQTGQAAQQASQALDQITDQFLPSRQKPAPQPSFQPKLGDRIRIPSLGQTAEVITAPNHEGELTVRFGIMKMNLNLADIESLTGEKAQPVAKRRPAAVVAPEAPPPMIRTSQNTVDLRGSRVAEAEEVLEEAIAQATGPLWIIHGHGTGKLRQGVQAFLKQHPRIDRYEFAEPADGGKGVTIAYLK